jgi:hypothetical protein
MNMRKLKYVLKPPSVEGGMGKDRSIQAGGLAPLLESYFKHF